MKARHIFMAVGLCISAWLAVFGDKKPATEIVEPLAYVGGAGNGVSPVDRTARNISSGPGMPMRNPDILALQDRETLFARIRNKSSSKGLFGSQSWMPPAPPPPKPTPAPAPMAPPLPFTYIGKKFEGNRWEVYITLREQVYIVHENAIVENNYHIDSITPPTMTITYVPLQQVQSLAIGGSD